MDRKIIICFSISSLSFFVSLAMDKRILYEVGFYDKIALKLFIALLIISSGGIVRSHRSLNSLIEHSYYNIKFII